MTVDRLFVDTGAWFAYTNAADPDHRRVRAILDDPPGRLVTSNYVFDETVTLTQARLGHRRAVIVGRALLDPALVELQQITPSDERAAWVLFEHRADKSYSFTDCTRALLVSNWPVETTSARTLTTDLFRRQATGPRLSRAQALQQTLNTLIDGGTLVDPETKKIVFSYAHPIFWAPFTVVGDGG